MKLSVLEESEWLEIWRSLPPTMQEMYWHPAYCAASANWEKAGLECLCVRDDGRYVIYPYLKHSISGYECVSSSAFDVQTPYGYGGPLFVDDWSIDAKAAALQLIYDHLRSIGAIAEFVRCHSPLVDAGSLELAGYRKIQVRTNVACDLRGKAPGEILPAWSEKARRDVKRAQKLGLHHRAANDPQSVAQFQRLYDMTADRLQMVPLLRYDANFTAALAAVDTNRVRIVVVEDASGNVVAAAMLFLTGGGAYQHLAGSDMAFRTMCPNDYLYWALAQEALAAGCQQIVWGGGTSNDPADSLFKFKSNFGRVFIPIFIAGRVIDPAAYDALGNEWAKRNPERAQLTRLFLRYRG